jgi:uncharacterized membrane protein required for colicin V production
MLTHLIKSINWIDAALFFLFIRMIFVGVKNGFISEFFKFLGVVVAVFVSLHFYSFLASWVAMKTKFSWDYWDLVIFSGLWFAVSIFFKFLRNGILILFKVETTHQGFDKYAAGIVAVGRGILVCSLTIFFILLTHISPLTRMTFHSYSYKIAGRAAVSTYSFLYNHLVDKLFAGEHYNAAAPEVLHPDETAPAHPQHRVLRK